MERRGHDLIPCYQCGWLGMCVIACPLRDPARSISPDCSTHPNVDTLDEDEAFEIVLADKPASDDTEG